MPSTICGDEELRALIEPLKEAGRGVFVVASGARATPEYLEAIAADTGRPTFMVTVLTMYTDANPGRAMTYYERCSEALRRGREVYIHANCQPLSFDFTLREPYPFMALGAFDRIKAAKPDELPGIYADPAFRRAFRESLKNPEQGVLFSGDWSKVEVDGVPLPRLAAGKDPLDFFCDQPLETQMIAKLFQNDDAGVAPLLRHEAGVLALSDAGAHPRLLLRRRLRPALPRALGARDRSVRHRGGRTPPDSARRGNTASRTAARSVRARGRTCCSSTRRRWASRTCGACGTCPAAAPHDPRTDGRIRRVGERRARARRPRLQAARGPGHELRQYSG